MGPPPDITKHFLLPGAIFAPAAEHLVTTILGSCVAVCLFDKDRRLGGINHFLLPLWNGDGLPTPKYGNVAIERLVEKLLQRGAHQSALVAKIFGGASMWVSGGGLLAVGERNIELAKMQLAELKIPIVAADLGGRVGRKVLFNTATGDVWMQRHQERP